jgi:hypothetical protein
LQLEIITAIIDSSEITTSMRLESFVTYSSSILKFPAVILKKIRAMILYKPSEKIRKTWLALVHHGRTWSESGNAFA